MQFYERGIIHHVRSSLRIVFMKKRNISRQQQPVRRLSHLFGLLVMLGPALVAGAQTITWQENWESPDAQECWAADFGYWEIGVPTFGPPTNSLGSRAHQGTNVAATVLGGNYTDDRQSRLSSCPIQVPAANPRLRFWHWWSFNCYDYGQVQISTNNGSSWVVLSPNYGSASGNYDSSGKWTQTWLDLTPYAGKTVRIGFFFQSASGFSCDGSSSVEVAPGWYVDEVVVESGSLPTMLAADSFEDALALDRWVADFGVWEIGVPTSGPPIVNSNRTHSGSNCLATILSGNYTDDRTSRISSQPLLVPAEGMNPRLRLWHWWSFNCYDSGQVQISTNNGASWVILSPTYGSPSGNYDSSGKWTRAWLDLTPYAGKTVRIGFFFQSASGFSCDGSSSIEVAPGWYVDEVVIESGPLPTMLAADSFEDALALDRWVADFGVWEIGVPTSGPGAAHEGTNCLATILSGDYIDDRNSRIRSHDFVVPPMETNPRLRFWHWWNFNCYDYGEVQISTNNGASWVVLATYSASSPWTRPQIDLSRYAGKTARIAFRFVSASGFSCDGSSSVEVAPGWYVDEIRLLHDFTASLLNSPVVRTQNSGCISLGIGASSPPSIVNFTVQVPSGHLASPILSTESCWSGGIVPLSGSQWAVTLTNNCAVMPMGVATAGSICFTATSTQSAFVPLTIVNMSGPTPPLYSFGSRAVTIANEPLLEATMVAGTRTLTTYGKANTAYEIRHATNSTTARPWPPAWTNIVPANLFTNRLVTGSLSNASALFLYANEQ